MPGGTWTFQDKVRPGAYVNFSADRAFSEVSPGNGVVTMGLKMSWGPEKTVFEVFATDMINGNGEALIGYPSGHLKAMAFKECLSQCHKVLAYRVNCHGNKAAINLGALVATAKYTGVRGNDISVSVVSGDSGFLVNTYVDGTLVESQKVLNNAVPLDNDWVVFTATGALTAAVATKLVGGTDGNATSAAYGDYFQVMKNKSWQIMALPSEETYLPPLLKAYIMDLRENCGKKVQGVAFNYAADYEGIITVDQGYIRNGITVAPHNFVAWVAGASAGAEIYESNTYKVIDDADVIVGEVAIDEIEAKLQRGFFMIARRTDGTIVVEQDINTLTSFNVNKSGVFSKNRVVRTLDKIANGISHIFEANYIGSINNNAEGRDLFKQDIIAFFYELQGVGAVEKFDGAEDIFVVKGTGAESVQVNLAVCPVDAMEKLYITVEVAA
ncbi:MAG: phage tail sheath family protein [Clostridiales bacterium]